MVAYFCPLHKINYVNSKKITGECHLNMQNYIYMQDGFIGCFSYVKISVTYEHFPYIYYQYMFKYVHLYVYTLIYFNPPPFAYRNTSQLIPFFVGQKRDKMKNQKKQANEQKRLSQLNFKHRTYIYMYFTDTNAKRMQLKLHVFNPMKIVFSPLFYFSF